MNIQKTAMFPLPPNQCVVTETLLLAEPVCANGH